MSDPQEVVEQRRAPARRQQIRVRIDKLRQSRSSSMLDVPEIIGLAAGAVLLIATIFAYFYFLTPARTRLSTLQLERTRLQTKLRTSRDVNNLNTNTQASIAKINESLQDFESNRLAGRGTGRVVLYDQLNALIRRNGLRNTAGPSYVTLDSLGAKQAGTSAANRPGSAKWQSIYPGIGVSVTVEGQYQNLRRFIRDIETSNQFLIINGVELESVTDSNAPTTAASPESGATERATLVSLRLDMATYFRRDQVAVAAEGAPPPTETR